MSAEVPPKITDVRRARCAELAPRLRAVRAGEVWCENDGRAVETFVEYFGVSDPIADVTEEMRLAESAGLARPAGMRWELTPAGQDALAEFDAIEVSGEC